MNLSKTIAILAKRSSRRDIKAEYLTTKAILGNRPSKTISVRYTKLKKLGSAKTAIIKTSRARKSDDGEAWKREHTLCRKS
jgi:hypothetical protein